MTNHVLPRSLVTLSAIFTLSTGVALTAAPSTARAETKPQITTGEGTFIIKDFDKGSMHFRDVVAEVQNGRMVVTAVVTMPATAGKPRTGSVVLSALMMYSDDGGFMDYTDDACTPSQMSRQAGEDACAAISGALHDGSMSDAPSTPEEGIIMRDGGVCDPIRHMGC
jgi:hypothetical protein